MNRNQVSILIIESDTEKVQDIVRILDATSIDTLIETAEDTDVALLKIIDINPHLVLMEYPPIGKTGSGIIKFIQSKLPQTTVAFLCNTKDYAAEAIHHEVYDYLLKPINKAEIEKLLEKVLLNKSNNPEVRIMELIENKQPDMRLGFNTIKGYIIINPEEILYCKADGAFTEVHFVNKSAELTFLFLSKVEEILQPYNFIRISRSIIVNKNFIRKVYLKTNTVVLTFNGMEHEIQGARLPIRALSRLYLD
jgi:DNA-binding LytR/AlgR family response regulator